MSNCKPFDVNDLKHILMITPEDRKEIDAMVDAPEWLRAEAVKVADNLLGFGAQPMKQTAPIASPDELNAAIERDTQAEHDRHEFEALAERPAPSSAELAKIIQRNYDLEFAIMRVKNCLDLGMTAAAAELCLELIERKGR